MLTAIELYDKASFTAIKINNILVDNFLPKKALRIRSQKVIPQHPLLWSLIFSQ